MLSRDSGGFTGNSCVGRFFPGDVARWHRPFLDRINRLTRSRSNQADFATVTTANSPPVRTTSTSAGVAALS
jgi:hypothetical protein